MTKYKIVALFGPAGSGKDYILEQTMKTFWGKTHLHQIISCTTRPPRQNEIDGVNYYFYKSPQDFIKQDLLEFTSFNNWQYGTPTKSLSLEKINIGVFNVYGLDQLINKDYKHRIDCLPIYIHAFDKIRLIRQLTREENPNCYEICRRFQTDKEDFQNLNFLYKVIENNTNEINPILTDIFSYIKAKWPI